MAQKKHQHCRGMGPTQNAFGDIAREQPLEQRCLRRARHGEVKAAGGLKYRMVGARLSVLNHPFKIGRLSHMGAYLL